MDRAYPVYSHFLFDGIEGCFYLKSFSKGQGSKGVIGGFDFSLDGGDAEGYICECVSSAGIVLGSGYRTAIDFWPLYRVVSITYNK